MGKSVASLYSYPLDASLPVPLRFRGFWFAIAVVLHFLVLTGVLRGLHHDARYGIRQGVPSMEVTLTSGGGSGEPKQSAPQIPVASQIPVAPAIEPKPEPVAKEEGLARVEKRPVARQSPSRPQKTTVGPSQKVSTPQEDVSQAPSVVTSSGGSAGGGTAGPSPSSGAATKASPDYLSNPAPVYPLISRRLREEGLVLLRVAIAESGNVEDVAISRSSGIPRLDDAALRAVKKWVFKPARFGSIAMKDSVEVPIRFTLND